ncbi:MAG: hypothetical protein GTO08_03210 [Deltaproteobacteria bacterium]|nr:hypothetical protein [Deltaproteobacteria bacterium]
MGGLIIYQSEILNGVRGLVHAFGSKGLDTSSPGEVPQDLRFLGIPPDRIVTLRQVHSSRVLIAREGDLKKKGKREGDGAVCLTPGLGMGILTADCLPVILASDSPSGFAMIHGGWRGLKEGIVESGLNLYRRLTGAHPESIKAAIGPGASSCCYKVGWDVARLFSFGYPECLKESAKDRFYLDLKGVSAKQLVSSGLLKHNVDMMKECTICDDHFHSVRREGGIKLRQINVAFLS